MMEMTEPEAGSPPDRPRGSVPGPSIHHLPSTIVTHSIRLGPPWDVTPGPDGTRHARHFGRPRALDPGERLWLVCVRVPGPAEVLLNAEAIGTLPAAGPFAADVTDRLRPRNVVVFAAASADPLGEVVLEMRPAGV